LWGLATRGYVWGGRYFVGEGFSDVYNSFIYAVYGV
jgi:hypothetical protein